MARTRRLFVWLLASFTIASLFPGPAHADSVKQASIPQIPANSKHAAAWFNGAAYLFGGSLGGGRDNVIVKFDPPSRRVTTLSTRLPTALQNATAVSNGQKIYIIGGEAPFSSLSRQIRIFDPSTATITTSAALMPVYGRSGLAAVWTGQYIFIFGGWLGGGVATDEILRYDPSTDSIVTMAARLPYGLTLHNAEWDGINAHILGGYAPSRPQDGYSPVAILRYDPQGDNVLTTSSNIPQGVYASSSIFDGTDIVILGGQPTFRQIVHFTPSTGAVSVSNTPFNVDFYYGAAAWDGRSVAYVFGNGVTGYLPQYKELLKTRLPVPVAASGLATTSEAIFVFGGKTCSTCGPTDRIIHADKLSQATHFANARLPVATYDSSAIFNGQYVFIFGGLSSSTLPTDAIFRYDPVTDSIKTMSARLPFGLSITSAFFDGTFAYIIGGSDQDGARAEILRYNPNDDTIQVIGSLPGPRYGTSVAFDGTYAYIIGGSDGGNYLSDVLRYVPGSPGTTPFASMPSGAYRTSAVWDGNAIYIFGGIGGLLSQSTRQILRLRPPATSIETMDARLPNGRSSMAATISQAQIELLGGEAGGSPTDDVMVYSLEPGVPSAIISSRGPGAGQITISWQPPSATSFAKPITGYSVYGGFSSSGSFNLLADLTPDRRSFTWSGLGTGETRYLKVQARNSDGEGPVSAAMSATAPVPPGEPRDLIAYPGPDYGENSVFWSAPSDNGGNAISDYHVYRQTDPYTIDAGCIFGCPLIPTITANPYVMIATVGPNTFSYGDYGCPEAKKCSYKISARNDVGEGSKSSSTAEFVGWGFGF